MNIKKIVVLFSTISLMLGSLVTYHAYGQEERTAKYVINQVNRRNSELNEVVEFLSQFEKNEIKLPSETKVNESVFTTNDDIYQSKKQSKEMDKSIIDSSNNKMEKKEDRTSPTLSTFDINNAKKIYLDERNLFDKIENNIPFDIDEKYWTWEIPMKNESNTNGIVSIGKSKATGKLKAEAISFPIDDRTIYLNNDEIVNIIYDFIKDTSNIEDIQFASAPISIMGTIVAIAKTDTGETLIIPVEDRVYYNGEELGKVYTVAEMKEFQRKFNEKMQSNQNLNYE